VSATQAMTNERLAEIEDFFEENCVINLRDGEQIIAEVKRLREEVNHFRFIHDESERPWGAKLSEMTCPQCSKPFVLTWKDYGYDEKTRQVNSGTGSTLDMRGCPSGGIYDVSISCPHCDYEEEL